MPRLKRLFLADLGAALVKEGCALHAYVLMTTTSWSRQRQMRA